MMRVGVVGGGQLAWMMADAAKSLNVQLLVQTPSPDDPAVAIAAEAILAAVDDATATARLASRCDVITFENEFVNLKALSPLSQQGVCFRPGLQALAPLLDKYQQRCYLRQLGLPVPQFSALEAAPPLHSFPVVLKARCHGYDGQGTFIIKDSSALQQKLSACSHQQHGLFLVEEFVPFERELAVIAARSTSGEVVTYPIVETQQQDQVCRRVLVPAHVNSAVAAQIEAIAHKLLNSLQAVGVFGIELFLTADDTVIVNEVAPRTHNSGHFTLDACETSQFQQHLRAVCGLPLGNPVLKYGGAVMVNLLGYEYSQNDYLAKRQRLAEIAQAHVHWYGKTQSRPGRKLGHVTVLLDAPAVDSCLAIAQTIESIWYSEES